MTDYEAVLEVAKRRVTKARKTFDTLLPVNALDLEAVARRMRIRDQLERDEAVIAKAEGR